MRTVRDVDVRGKRVLLRVDYNVPLKENGAIADARRIEESLPTLNYLLSREAKVVLLSHLGRPNGHDPSLSLRPVAQSLSGLLGCDIGFVGDCVGKVAEAAASKLRAGECLLMENLRFHSGEEKNDPPFAAALSRMGDIFVEDAFGCTHRAHASTVGITHHLPTYAGLLVEKEVRELGRLLLSPDRPYAAIIGGAKVKDKLPLLKSLVSHVNMLFVGGAMALPLIDPRGINDEHLKGEVQYLMARAREASVDVILPEDFVVRNSADRSVSETSDTIVPKGYVAFDIGKRSRKLFKRRLTGTRTVFLNGPLGKAEEMPFAGGTREVVEQVGKLVGTRILAGGDTARVVRDLGLQDAFTYISTGGGAALEFVQGRVLPGLSAILESLQGSHEPT